jgi:hypothetical protein
MYKIIVATAALFAFTAPSLAIEGNSVHSLRADNVDFYSYSQGALKSGHSFAPKAMVDPIQTGSNGNAGAASTSNCLGVSPHEYDPFGRDCRN